MLGSASATAYAWCRVRASHRRWGSSSHFSATASPPTSCRSTSSCSRNSRSHRPARSSATRWCARSLRGCLTDPCEFGVPQMDEPYARFSRLKIDRPHPRVLRGVMNRPDKLNAADREMHSNLSEIWRVIDADASVNAVLLTGAGKAFSAGGDLELVGKMMADFDTRMRVWKEARDMVYNMINCSKPVVSAINGAAVGAGLVVAILADISIAANSAKLIDGHTKLGVAAGDHAAIIWPLLCGMAKAKYHLLLCEPSPARRPSASASFRWRCPMRSCGRARSTLRCGWRKAPRTRSVGPSMRSTTGCARPGRSSTPRSAWNSSASPEPSCRKASRRCARSALCDFRPTASSETAGDNDADRNHQIGRAATARQLQRMLQGRPLGVRRRPDRQRLQDRRSAGGASRSGVSVLRFRHQAADALRPRQPEEDLRGRRQFVRSCLQSSGLHDRPCQLQCL